MIDRKVDAYWRPAYELFASFAWLLSSIATALFGYYGDFGLRFLLLASIPMGIIGFVRLYQGLKIVSFKANLFSMKDLKLNLYDIMQFAQKNPGKIYYGHGFLWEQDSTQRAVDYSSRPSKSIKPNPFYMSCRKFLGLNASPQIKGSMYLHGLGGDEQPIFMPVDDRFTHRVVGGTTGTGKGRVLAIDVIQAIARDNSCLLIDPKGDHLLAHTAYATMKLKGKEDLFFYFNPTEPLSSVRINPLANFFEVSQLTDRVISLMGDTSDPFFKNFAWKGIQVILSALVFMHGQPTLYSLKVTIESNLNELLKKVGCFYLSQYKKSKQMANQIVLEADPKKASSKFVKYYEEHMKTNHPNTVVEGVITLCASDQSKFKELMQNIMPILEMLTQGSLKELLSPEEGDNDPRPIVNLKKVADIRAFLYANLASLVDQTVGSYIGALLVSDAVSVAGYRHDTPLKNQVPFYMWVDEASEVVNKKAIMIANKTRSADVAMTLAFQTMSDLELALGSRAAAEMMLGNLNCVSQLRAKDMTTAEYVASSMGETKVKSIDHSHTTQSIAIQDDVDFNTGYGKAIKDGQAYNVTPNNLLSLADLHYFNQFAGNIIYKLRVPYISIPEHLKFPKLKFTNDPHGKRDTIDVMSRQPLGNINFDKATT